MYLLEYFFNNFPKVEKFLPRKLDIPNNSFLLYGARGVGKSTLIANILQNLPKDSFLYIDAQDPMFVLEDIEAYELEEFIKNENIKTLVIDHYFEGFLDYLPEVDRLIIISRKELNLNLEKKKLYPLDFEEFFNFQKAQLIQHNFSLYTKFGTLPQIAKNQSPFAHKELFFEKFDTQEGKVILILALFHTKVATTHQIYQRARDYFKISKDWLYMAIKNYEQEGIIYQIDTLEKGFGKKIILYDFAFAKYLNKTITFNAIFDSIVALALIKHNIKIKAIQNPIGYITKQNDLILISPFDSEESFWAKVQTNFGFYTNLNPKSITIVTMSNSYSFKIKNLKFNAIPITEWIVGVD
jgi:predicted AAA+ superfamily ATPase